MIKIPTALTIASRTNFSLLYLGKTKYLIIKNAEVEPSSKMKPKIKFPEIEIPKMVIYDAEALKTHLLLQLKHQKDQLIVCYRKAPHDTAQKQSQ